MPFTTYSPNIKQITFGYINAPHLLTEELTKQLKLGFFPGKVDIYICRSSEHLAHFEHEDVLKHARLQIPFLGVESRRLIKYARELTILRTVLTK